MSMRFLHRISAAIPAITDRLYRKSRSPLLRGDLKAYAEAEYPPQRYPTAWKVIPDDLRRPLMWDGRLLNGRDVAELAKAHVDENLIGQALVKSGIRALILLAIIGLAVAACAYSAILNSFYDLTPYPAWAAEYGLWKPIIGWYVLTTIERVWIVASVALSAALPLALLFPLFWYGAFTTAMNRIWNRIASPLCAPTRDTRLFWKANMATRQLQYRAYCSEVEQATGRLKDQPFIAVGQASGIIRARGDMEAPSPRQIIGYDGESIRQHTLVLGGTGSGKTRLVVRPMFKRIMSANWGEGHKIGAYVTDGKGTLHTDLMPMVADRDDVVVIGAGIEQKGVNLTEGMTPLEVATTFKAVSGQISGAPADDFWPESASLLLMHAAAIGRALDLHEATREEWRKQRKVTPYSLLGIALLATEEKFARESFEKLEKIAEDLADDATPEQAQVIIDAMDSARWLEFSFLEMAKETRSSIIANVNVTLGKLRGAPEIAKRFCSGNYADVVDVTHALYGGIVMVAVGETDHGLAGKVVTCWLKTRLYIMARRRLVEDPEACETTSCAIFADEFQMLATTGPDSDATFFNIARQTGVFMAAAATQSLAALKQVMGEDVAANLVNLMRSKIVLKTEELSTLAFVQKIAGEIPRGWEYENDYYPTQAAREIALGNVGPRYVDLPWHAGLWPKRFVPATGQRNMYSAAALRKMLMRQRPDADTTGLWTREEDRIRSSVMDGLQFRPKVDFDELLLGSGMAFAIVQRAGGDRMDLVNLDIAA